MPATLYTARNDKTNKFRYCWCYDSNSATCCNFAAQFTDQRLRKTHFMITPQEVSWGILKQGPCKKGQPLTTQKPRNFTHSSPNKLPKQGFHKRATAFQLPVLLVRTRIIFVHLPHYKHSSCGNSITQILCLPSRSISFIYVTCLREYITSNHGMYYVNFIYHNAT
jgi:hypothetical protein